MHSCNPSTGKVEAGGPDVQGHLQLPREIERNQGQMRLYLKTNSEPVHFQLGRSHGGGQAFSKGVGCEGDFPRCSDL